MKLITKSADTSYLHIMRSLLEENGIPAVIHGVDTARMITPFITQASLWVYLDEQADEAANLVNNNEYIVINKIDIGEFYRINDDITSDTSVMNAAFLKLGGIILSWLIGAFILLIILKWLTT